MPRHHPLAPHRLLLVAAVAVLALVALLGTQGPHWWRRYYHPLHYESAIGESARANDLDPYLIAAVINSESSFDKDEVSRSGAIGLMQLMPNTAREVDPSALGEGAEEDALRDPEKNIKLGTKYLAGLMRRYDDTATALAAYNAGSSNADRWASDAGAEEIDESIKFPETRRYVRKVLEERSEYERLYPGAFDK